MGNAPSNRQQRMLNQRLQPMISSKVKKMLKDIAALPAEDGRLLLLRMSSVYASELKPEMKAFVEERKKHLIFYYMNRCVRETDEDFPDDARNCMMKAEMEGKIGILNYIFKNTGERSWARESSSRRKS